jgi:hypothetical protein
LIEDVLDESDFYGIKKGLKIFQSFFVAKGLVDSR